MNAICLCGSDNLAIVQIFKSSNPHIIIAVERDTHYNELEVFDLIP